MVEIGRLSFLNVMNVVVKVHIPNDIGAVLNCATRIKLFPAKYLLTQHFPHLNFSQFGKNNGSFYRWLIILKHDN